MIIKKIELKNFQVIGELSADFSGNVYLIKGENEMGKATLLKAIGALLTGNRDEVLKLGEDKGFAKMIVGDDGNQYEVELRFTKANPRGTLTIKDNKGMKSDNVSMLQRILKYTDFDAVEFSRWSETAEGRRKQIQIIKGLLPDEVRNRIEEIDTETETIKRERKEQNAAVKTLATLKQGSEVSDDVIAKYKDKVEISELIERQKQAAVMAEKAKGVEERIAQRSKEIEENPAKIERAKDAFNAELYQINEDRKRAIEIYQTAISQCEEREQYAKTRYESSISTLNAEFEKLQETNKQAKEWLANYQANKPDDLTAELSNAEEHNKMCDKVSKYLEIKERYDKAVGDVEKSETAIAKLADERAELIRKSKLPIDGLTFSEDGLILNGIPFIAGKVSDSQIMEVAAKLCIASNPTVNVFKIGRGESLGSKRLQAIVDIASANGFQGFIEQVQRGQNELLIEEYEEK